MRVRIILARVVVPVVRVRFFRRELFEPRPEIAVQSGFMIVDEDARRDVHRINEAKSFLNPALPQGRLDLIGDIDEPAAGGVFKPKFLTMRLHLRTLWKDGAPDKEASRRRH